MQLPCTDLPVLVCIRLTLQALKDEIREPPMFNLRLYPSNLIGFRGREDEVVIGDGRFLDLDAEWA